MVYVAISSVKLFFCLKKTLGRVRFLATFLLFAGLYLDPFRKASDPTPPTPSSNSVTCSQAFLFSKKMNTMHALQAI